MVDFKDILEEGILKDGGVIYSTEGTDESGIRLETIGSTDYVNHTITIDATDEYPQFVFPSRDDIKNSFKNYTYFKDLVDLYKEGKFDAKQYERLREMLRSPDWENAVVAIEIITERLG